MMKKKTLEERLEGDILSDSTQFSKCEQCKNCIFRDDGTVYSNDYRKSSCRMYPYPRFKPLAIMNNTENCEFYEQEKRKK